MWRVTVQIVSWVFAKAMELHVLWSDMANVAAKGIKRVSWPGGSLVKKQGIDDHSNFLNPENKV